MVGQTNAQDNIILKIVGFIVACLGIIYYAKEIINSNIIFGLIMAIIIIFLTLNIFFKNVITINDLLLKIKRIVEKLKGIWQIKLPLWVATTIVFVVLVLVYNVYLPIIPQNNTNPSPAPIFTPTVFPASPATVVSTSNATPKPNQNNFTNSFGLEFVQIPAGEFDMGSPENEASRDDDEGPVHRVKIVNAFYMSKYEITQKEWRDVMATDPSYFKGDNLPVEQVSWNEVQEFISRLNEKEGTKKYHLPTEAEWEYAARAGSTTRFYSGDDASKLGDYEWFDVNSGREAHEVGKKKPNPWGLYDMHGNVWEWVQDVYHTSYNGAPTDGSAWEGNGSHRIIRGGSFDYYSGHLRSANRNDRDPGFRHYSTGFRLVMKL